jgi:hypothetical protein
LPAVALGQGCRRNTVQVKGGDDSQQRQSGGLLAVIP